VAGLKRELPVETQEAIERHEAAGTFDSPEYEAASVEWVRRHVCRNETALDSFFEALGDP